jgi:hypothetical protein
VYNLLDPSAEVEMSQMIRKQIYIQKRQQARLRRLARARGISEAAVIREALDRQLSAKATETFQPDPAAWKALNEFMLTQQALGPLEQRSRDWKREDLYEERLSRRGRHSD